MFTPAAPDEVREGRGVTTALSKTRMHIAWRNMHARCKTSWKQRKDYADRGIRVCIAWRNFDLFRDHILSLLPVGSDDIPHGLTIDRIDNDCGYQPGNVRLVTQAVNNSNKRNSVLITINGVSKSRTEWCRDYGISEKSVRYRISRGMSPIDAITTPPGPRLIEIGEEKKTQADWCRYYGIGEPTVCGRIKRGWDTVRALTTPAAHRGSNKTL